LECFVAGFPIAASISVIASIHDVAAHNVPVASSVAVDSAVADVFFLPLALLCPHRFSWFLLFPASLLVWLFLLLLMPWSLCSG
jgi:hypothetical protein